MRKVLGRRPNAAHVRRLVLLAALAGPWTSAEALANGRFPRSQRLIEDPSNPDHLMLAATYGLATTTDRGKSWYHVCEAAFAGDSSYMGDPLLELVAGGALLVGVQATIRRSSDGCTWTPTLGTVGGAASQNINDFAIDRAHGTTVVAVVTRLVDSATSIELEQSDDAGRTWRAVGTRLPLSSVATIDLDPTDSTHIFATGLAPAGGGDTGVLLKSFDRGTTWIATSIPNTDSSNVPYIAAIDPQDPSKIFVRTDSYVLPAGAPEEAANDALVYSKDGGSSWMELLRQNAKLLGFSLSPDGATILAGYGDPVESGYSVDPAATGIYTATVADLRFLRVFSGSVTGLTWALDGVYACTAQPASGSREELAFFGNGALTPNGPAPTYLMKLSDIRGPPPCCAAVASLCDWQSVCATYPFFSCADGGTNAFSCDSGSTADAPSGDAFDSASTDGTTGAGAPRGDASALMDTDGASGDALGADAAAPVGPGRPGAGCACRFSVTRASVERAESLWALCLLSILAFRRRAGEGSAAGLGSSQRPRAPAGRKEEFGRHDPLSTCRRDRTSDATR
jgi:sortilin (neurotensin receptor 3)